MRARFRHFYDNAGKGGVIRTVVIHVAVIAIVAGALMSGEIGWAPPAAGVVAWLVPFFGQRALTARPEVTQRVLNVCGFAIVIGAAVGADALRSLGTDRALLIVLSALSGYISAYWWLLSDPEVVIIGKKR